MSEIRFVEELGDALEEAFAAESAHEPGRRRRWWRRPRVLISFAVVATACGALAAHTLLNSTTLAMNPVACFAGTTTGAPVTFADNNGNPPVQVCAHAMRVPQAKLTACAGGPYNYVSVFYADGPGQCARLGLHQLPAAAYHSAQLRIARLSKELVAIQTSAPCVTPPAFAARAELAFHQLGFTDWRVNVGATRAEESSVIGGGWCAMLPGYAFTLNPPSTKYALDPANRVLELDVGPPPALLRLLATEAASLGHVTGARCWSLTGLRAYITQRLRSHGLSAVYHAMAEQGGGEYGDRRQGKYNRGCATFLIMRTAVGDHRLIDVLIQQRGAAPPPSHGLPPQSAFR